MENVLDVVLYKIKYFLYKARQKNATKENLYTILEFKDKEDFENWINWQSYASSLENDMDHSENSEIAKNIVENIVTNTIRKKLGNTSNKNKAKSNKVKNEIKQQLDDLAKSNKAKKAKEKISEILCKVDGKQALAELQVIKKQAEDFVQGEFYQSHKKELEKPGTIAALFVKMRNYIMSLEKSAKKSVGTKIQTLLFNRVMTLKVKSPELLDKMNDAMAILGNNELRKFYDIGIQDGTLSHAISYKECVTKLEDSMIRQAKEQRIGDLKKVEELIEKVKELIQSITGSVSFEVINKNKQSIFYCRNHQNDCIKESKGFRYGYYQKMIDICQKRIDTYQKEIDRCINPIQKVFDSLSQKIRATDDMMEFKSMIDNLQTKHDTLPSKERVCKLSMLTCLTNTQDKICKVLARYTPSTDLLHTKHDQSRLGQNRPYIL